VHAPARNRDRARAQKQHDRKGIGRGPVAVGLHLLPTHCSVTPYVAVQVACAPRRAAAGEKVAVAFGEDLRGAEGECSPPENMP